MSKFVRIGMGISAVCLVAFMLLAGCTSQQSGNPQGQTPGPQSSTIAGTPSGQPQVTNTPGTGSSNPETGLFIDDSGNTPNPSEQVTMAPDLPVEQSNGMAGQNLTPDSTDFGDITP